jgi:hypothetical protein
VPVLPRRLAGARVRAQQRAGRRADRHDPDGRPDRSLRCWGGGGNCLPAGIGDQTGESRRLGGVSGADFSNDHPMSFVFDSGRATSDGELQTPPYGSNPVTVGLRTDFKYSSANKPRLPLFGSSATDQAVECSTCHDPHLSWTGLNQNLNTVPRDLGKFLRVNRFQRAAPGIGQLSSYNAASDQICVACHKKDGWVDSVHANDSTANEPYPLAESVRREFPDGITVWQAGCLNCHDTHTNTGAQRLLRYGASGATNQAQTERMCFQCHGNGTNTNMTWLTLITKALGGATVNTGLVLPASGGAATTASVPDIQTEFQKAVSMPLNTRNTDAAKERHTIRNRDFEECRQDLGAVSAGAQPGTGSLLGGKCDTLPVGTNANRHVECTDCHNPHRVRRGARFDTSPGNAAGAQSQRTHNVGGAEGNVISGALRGAWGVQPQWPATVGAWPELPTSYQVKRGDPPATGPVTVNSYSRTAGPAETYMTREFQLCFKCHSDYANPGASTPTATSTYPPIGNTPGGTTAANANGLTRYTNVAAEFAITTGDSGEFDTGDTVPSNPNGAPDGAPTNHRSWHPVMLPTGRTAAERAITVDPGNILAPFRANLGTQTMHCSDCHGSGGSWTVGTGPNHSTVQGPHGSGNAFLLKGGWSFGVKVNDHAGSLCGNCHNPGGATSGGSGFATSTGGWANHRPDGNMAGNACMRCHIAVPHGWKNKAFLVNLNCVGVEGGQGTGACVSVGAWSTDRNYPPYYNQARLAISPWARSGAWTAASCTGCSGPMKDCAGT